MAKHVAKKKFKLSSESLKTRDYFDFSVLSVRQLIALIFSVIAFVAIIVLTCLSGYGSFGHYKNNEEYKMFGDGWSASYYDADGTLVENKYVSLSNFKFDNSVNETKIVFSKNISAVDLKIQGTDLNIAQPNLGFYFNSKSNIYRAYADTNNDGTIDFDVTYDYNLKNGYIGSNSVLVWTYIELPKGVSDYTINIETECYDNNLNLIYIHKMMIGSANAMYSRVRNEAAVPFVIGLVLLVISAVAGVFILIARKAKSTGVFIAIYLGICTGLYSMAHSGYIWLVFDFHISDCYIKALCLSALIFGFSLTIYGKAANVIFVNFGRVLLWVSILLVFGSMLIGAFNLADLSAFVIYLMFILAFVVILSFVNYIILAKNDSSQKPLAIGAGFITLALIVEVVIWYLNLRYLQMLTFTSVAILFFLASILLEYRLAYDSSSVEVKKQQIENDQKVAIMLAQIQPHFLYNSLNSIAILCDINPKKAHDLTLKFSQYLRNNIDALSQQTPIHFTTELKNIKNYLEIEKVRFSDKLNVVENIQTSDFFVPVLTIQPIVENAVKHGVSKRSTPGAVMINSSEDINNYYVVVEDNGVGFNTDIIDKGEKLGKSIGITNVKYRLKSVMNADVDIQSEIGKGTKVTITFPKVSNKVK